MATLIFYIKSVDRYAMNGSTEQLHRKLLCYVRASDHWSIKNYTKFPRTLDVRESNHDHESNLTGMNNTEESLIIQGQYSLVYLQREPTKTNPFFTESAC